MSHPMLDTIRRVLLEEAAAIESLAGAMPDAFEQAVHWIVQCEGRVITCGVGKSGHIARKTAGTLASTGTPSLFMHAAEAVHGDLGMVTDRDIVLAYSHSGETDEIVRLFPSIHAIGAKSILMTGRPESSAGRASQLVLDTRVSREACPNNLAPTTSTTVMLALSDALAVAAMEVRQFGREDFAKFHPSGALGKRLLLTVSDVMRTGADNALVGPGESVHDVLRAITKAGAGAACVVDAQGVMVGIISDGDIRRYFLNEERSATATASDLMSPKFSSVRGDLLAIEALEYFQNHPKKIGEVPVVDEAGRVLGMLVLKDLLRSGIV